MWVRYKGMTRDDLGNVVATVYPAFKVHKVSACFIQNESDCGHLPP